MAELRRRLGRLGFTTDEDPPDQFGPATRAAVEAFQHRRGLRVDGRCGPQTWSTLVEAGWRLGQRVLARQTPMLRGDDVAELQQRLGALGFDSGRVDGIFGDNTEAGVLDFQRNAGIVADGVVGPVTVRELRRMQARHRQIELVSTVRARERLRSSPPTLAGRHVALGEPGGLAPAVAALASCLAATGARVTALHDPDDSAQAQAANAGEAEVLVGLRTDPDGVGCATAYYAGYRTESEGGRRLAELIQSRLPAALGVADGGCRGMSVPLLRETKMPAVVVELSPSALAADGLFRLAAVVTGALEAWAARAWE